MWMGLLYTIPNRAFLLISSRYRFFIFLIIPLCSCSLVIRGTLVSRLKGRGTLGEGRNHEARPKREQGKSMLFFLSVTVVSGGWAPTLNVFSVLHVIDFVLGSKRISSKDATSYLFDGVKAMSPISAMGTWPPVRMLLDVAGRFSGSMSESL